MNVIRTRPESELGPAERFTGTVSLDPITVATDTVSRLRAYHVHFQPGSRTAWHTHPRGQVLYVLEGVGRVQLRGRPAEEIRAGDTVVIDPGESHWHGAAPRNFMTHLAMQEVGDDGSSADWGEHVSDAEYLAAGG